MIEPNKAILVVEDNPADFFATERGLRKAGLANPIVHAESGEQALDYLHGTGSYAAEGPQKPGIVLLDVNLPGLNGGEVLERIRADDRLKLVPVIMLTTSNDERDVQMAYRLGANSYIQKPVDLDGFMAALKRLKDYWFELVILPRS
ncbi:MAG: response regulator [Pseudomonadota bacterium]